MRYCLTADQYEALYDELEAKEVAHQCAEWVDEGFDLADFRPVDVYVRVTRRIEAIERQRAEAVAENRYEMRGVFAM